MILEAMCAGLPIISSKYADGAYDLVTEGENGYIVDPYDGEKLRSCIRSLLYNTETMESMGEASRKRVEQFRFERVSKGFLDAFAFVTK